MAFFSVHILIKLSRPWSFCPNNANLRYQDEQG